MARFLQSMKKHQLPVRPPFFYGWLIVMIGALGAFFSGPGQTYTVSVFIDVYIEEFNWSRTEVSTYYSVATLAAGFSLFLIGRFIDKKGQRIMSVFVGGMLALACFWNSLLIGPVMMIIGFYFLRLFGQGSMTLVPNTLIPQWFYKYRGRALSFMTLGVLVSAASFPPVNVFLIEQWGWRFAWQFWGILLLCVFIPLSLFFIRNKPQDVGLLPDNEKVDEEDGEKEGNKKPREISWTVKEAMSSKSFWFVLLCAAVPSLVNTGITFHLFSILGEKGVDRTYVAFLLSLMPIMAFLCTVASGFIVEKVPVHFLYTFAFLLKSVILVWLIFTDSLWAVTLFVVFWGVFDGVTKICNNIIWPNYFGLDHLGRLKSMATTSVVVGSALGPLPFGLAFDLFGGYTEILIGMIGLAVIAMLLAYFSPPPQKTE